MSTKLQALIETAKRDTRLLGAVERHLLAEYEKPSDRPQDVIHPSEMSKKDWCHRATYYRLTGDYPHIPPDPRSFSFSLENVFNEGSAIHEKWQSRLWDMGVLAGVFYCVACENHFEALAPERCEYCSAGKRRFLRYREVPIFNDEHLILGHSDGEIHDDKGAALLEVKSIGVGTVRFEAPELVKKYSRKVTDEDGGEHTYVDYDAMWREIRRPFPSHLRQGNIYMFCRGIHTMVFIYEYKPNQQVKEFVIKFQPSIVEPLLDACLDIKWGLEKKRPPACPNDPNGCEDCKRYEENDSDGIQTDNEPDAPERKSVTRRTRKTSQGRSDTSAQAGGRTASSARGTRRIVRRRTDAPVQSSDGVG